MKYATLGSIALTTLLVSGFSGCGSDSDTSSVTSTTPSLTGYYLDSAVAGVDYNTSGGYQGYTGSDGSFKFNAGDSVSLRLGDITLRNISSANLTNGKKIIETDDAVITFLQSIDDDGNATNGISVTSQTRTAVQEWATENSITSLEVNATHLIGANELQTKLQANDLNQTQIKTIEEARTHLAATLAAEPDAKILYTDYKGETREALSSAAAAEYHTGEGYGHTLFDSADNKCQNCHNELYDTWKGSMHGKSWSDPIFQSKYQDFLRTQINKIGEDKTSVGGIPYTEAMVSKVALTCVKCHAPAAYYAGDFKATLTTLQTGADTTALQNAQANDQSNLATTTTTYDPTQEASVVAVSHTTGTLYKLSYHVGHEANREGINCAFCHSIETPRLMGLTQDPASYTLLKDLRVGPHGPVKAAAGTALNYNVDATDPDMNKFFRLWGPEKYSNPASTPKNVNDYDIAKSADGRYTMASKDLNGTDGKVHYTGGPFYGPFGVTGLRNENSTDETNRTAQVHPDFDYATNNHFGNNGKTLCLSCHQRSAGAAVPSGEDGAGQFMELCSTWNAVTTGTDDNIQDTATSPKCTKCHMERIEGKVLHQWASPDKLFTDKTLLTSHFYADDSEGFGDENPVASGWLNSHAFLGASKTGGDKAAAVAKIKSGFNADVTTSVSGNILTVTTTITNKTAHMFPGAHPMRRTLSRIIVTDENGTMLPVVSATGASTFGDITNSVATLTGKTLHSSAASSVSVNLNGSDALDFPGKVADLNGSAVSSQKFTAENVTITGADTTIANQYIDGTDTKGTVFNAAIINSTDTTNFTRIYGHETGKKYDLDNNTSTPTVFVVRPGFDSNMVESDNRLSPNETETYTLTYDISGKTGVSTTYKVYYMQKGANGKFLTGADGWLDQALSDSKKLLVTEVFSKTVTEN
ncbi:multiheme c-type cytochrome [Sulfurimonas microaerophilic]|uniref:multiheme c-type cytochrome n=1 Tax=Sulfurimonas microaerophilic TaxID=3058392 RepID=UPI00271497CA|nr:multiheme c-type cytochrome [Sulfurimonas sp. hsl 1-7]